MSKIIVVTGDENTGKSELLTKLYETILRWYDNYDLQIEKQPINSHGDFLADIRIKRNTSFEKNKKKDSIRILINTAGDELENFTLLDKKINEDFNFLIMALRKEDKDKSLKDIYSKLKSHPGTGKTKNLPNEGIQKLFSSSAEFFNTHHSEREKNLMCIMKEIVCCIDTTI